MESAGQARIGEVATGATKDDVTVTDRRGMLPVPPPQSAASKEAAVDTAETTNSTTYTDLATVGPSVTLDVPDSGVVWVGITVEFRSNTSGSYGAISVALSGANTVAAADVNAVFMTRETYDWPNTASGLIPLTGLTPGSTTFTLKYKRGGSVASLTFANRKLVVLARP